MFLRLFGLYCSACFGILFASIHCTCCSHFFWYCFSSFTMFCAPVFFPLNSSFLYPVLLFQASVSEINSPLTESKNHCRLHKGPLLNCVLSQLNSIHKSIQIYFCYVTSEFLAYFMSVTCPYPHKSHPQLRMSGLTNFNPQEGRTFV
jgi:hypothetical protein